MKVRKTVTAAKAAANKKNSGKSTGAKTVRGKGVARMNALKYGILAADMLLPGESRLEFEQVRRKLFTDFAPVGSGESDKVEVYLANYWRLPRVYRAEAGEITKSLSEFNPRAEIATSEHAGPYRQAVADLKELEKIEEEIGLQALVSSENLDWLRKLPYGEVAKDLVGIIELAQDAESREGRGMPPAAESEMPASDNRAATSPEDGSFVRDLLLNGVECLKNTIRQEILYHGEYLPRRLKAKRNALQVPQEAVLNRFMRYENHLLQNMYRAQHELERMQRLRRGDVVPPPSARVT